MAELILKSNGKADETIHLQDKVQVKEILHEADWDSLSSIMIVHNTFNTLSFVKRNGEGMFGLLLNGKVYEDATVYKNKSAIIDSFLMFIMEKNRYKISRPFVEIEQKKEYRSRGRSDEYEYSNQEYDRKPEQSYSPEPSAQTVTRPAQKRPLPKPFSGKKIDDKGIGFKGIWWVIAIAFMIFRACSR